MLSDFISESTEEGKYHKSGDPFVNAGLIAIELFLNKPFVECSDDELKKAAEWLVDLYMKPAWAKELQSLFPNSKYINIKIKDKKADSLNFLNLLIENLQSEESEEKCLFCGGNAFTLEKIYKSHIPLTGTGKFVNYFPSFQDGLSICAKYILAVQFAPLICYKTGGKPCLVSSNNPGLIYQFGKEAINSVKEKLADGSLEDENNSGIFNENYKNSQNALFNLAYKFGTEYCRAGICSENDSVTLYKINNYNRNPSGIEIYSLPSNVFSFVAAMMRNPAYKKDWFSIIRPYYFGLKNKEDTEYWKLLPNRVHLALLEGQSILWAFKDDKAKRSKISWDVVEFYETKVRYMNQQRINDIKDFSDKIAESIEKEGKVKKRVNALVSANDLIEFRNQLRIICSSWQKQGNAEPLVGYDEYVRVLIPGDYRGWTEVRDLMAIRLYEKLHESLSDSKDPEDINEEDS